MDYHWKRFLHVTIKVGLVGLQPNTFSHDYKKFLKKYHNEETFKGKGDYLD